MLSDFGVRVKEIRAHDDTVFDCDVLTNQASQPNHAVFNYGTASDSASISDKAIVDRSAFDDSWRQESGARIDGSFWIN